MNLPAEHAAYRRAHAPLPDFRCAYDGDRVVATGATFHFSQWFGGAAQPMAGIFGVATLPEYRGAGVMREVMQTLMREALARDQAITALYPAVLGPYRSLGYELAGTYNEHRLPIDAIPADVGDASLVREYRAHEDLDAVRACYREVVRFDNGPLELDERWWTDRLLNTERWPTLRMVVVPGADGIEAFAAISRQATTGPLDVAFGLACEPLVATTERGLRAVLAYARGYRGVGQWLQWVGPPHDPVSLVIPEQHVATNWRYGWMLRLLDVPRALERRGWPHGLEVSATFAVDDPLFPSNAGPWRLDVRGGAATVVPVEDAPSSRPLSIPALSSLFSGYTRAHEAVRLGWLTPGDPLVDAFTSLFAGPDPWTGFFF
jgi:predicted acetyltransferase